MAKTLTLTANTVGKIDAAAGRKALVVCLDSGSAVWGFEPDTTGSGATKGLPVPAAPGLLTFTADEPRTFAAAIYFYSTAGATLLYTEKL